ncbi:hypothetical protein [Infirmifilum uzonense]|nr:hypothetical protein [Infirmifilum uzonense]
MTPPTLTKPALINHLAMCGFKAFGNRYLTVQGATTPGGVTVDLVAISVTQPPAVHATIAATTYSEALASMDKLVKIINEKVANAVWLAIPFEVSEALGGFKRIEKAGIGLIVVKAQSSFGLGSAEVLVEVLPKVEARKQPWPDLQSKLKEKGKPELALELEKTLGKKPSF